MSRIDAHYLEDPCSGSRRMVGYLARDGIPISRDRVRKLMRRMGFEVGAFYWTVLAPDIVNPGREEQGSASV
jgi:hypothetical protein